MAKSKPTYVRKGHEVISAIQALAGRYPTYQIFQDFLECSAISISNCVDWGEREKREEQYLQIINKYTPEEQKKLANILTSLVAAMQNQIEVYGAPCDVLGEVFHGLELHNKYHGQFFTPNHVCEMMGRITVGSETQDAIQKQGYISLCEPCVGAGGMVIGFAAAMHHCKMDYQNNLCVTACDIDIKCVHMAYLQLSLYGIPAVIVHGNSLTLEEWSKWYTPAYMLGMWPLKERRGIKDVASAVKEKTASEVKQQSYEVPPAKDVELRLTDSGQYSLF